ncbi:membrane protein insertase YidC [mine drainage metagenome]|uniref:Membrane protein insertase YidC n=1 Tax=mine drainage metagenome TaxID=410659 RepID=A0A1J5REH6_9ZZZZ
MDFRRSVLWVIFTISVIFLYNSWLRYNGQSGLFGEPAAVTAKAPASAGRAGDVPTPALQTPAALPGGAAAASVAPGVASAPKATLTSIRTDVLDMKVSSEGGNLVYAKLLKYASHADAQDNLVLLDNSPNNTYMAQSGLVGGDFPNHKTPMTLLPGPTEMGGADTLTVRMQSPVVGGLQLTRSYTFKRGSYVIAVSNEIVNKGTTPATPQLYLQLVRDGNDPSTGTHFYHTFTGPAIYDSKDKFQKFEFKDIGDQTKTIKSDDGWLAMVQHYFVSAWLPHPDKGPREFYLRKLEPNLYATGVMLPLPTLAPGARTVQTDTLYVGPEIESQLQGLAPGFELVKDYGWVTIIAKPLFWVLEQIHAVLRNWGWSIIALTVLLKLLFFPLTAASYRSMARMKAVAPRLNALRERHKNDQAAMNAAMVEMYRKEKINPLGGCLPIVIQIPVFIALYWVLLSSVELRGAPWLGWIHDLSAKDPYYILPAIMTATSFLQVKLNPTPPDPMQARLMWIMPAAFSVMFFFFPAGLVLYWLTNNLISIAQQWFINKKMGVPEFSDPK